MIFKRNFGTGFVDRSLVQVVHFYAGFVLNVCAPTSVAQVKNWKVVGTALDWFFADESSADAPSLLMCSSVGAMIVSQHIRGPRLNNSPAGPPKASIYQ